MRRHRPTKVSILSLVPVSAPVEADPLARTRPATFRPVLTAADAFAVPAVAAPVLLFSLLPLAALVAAALFPAGAFDLAPALAEITGRGATLATWHTLETGLWSAAGAALIGTALAFLLVLSDMPGRSALAFAFVFSSFIAPQVIALAMLNLTGPASPLLAMIGLAPPPGTRNPLQGPAGISLVLALHHAPLVFITVASGLRTLPREQAEAALASGASTGLLLRRVLLPPVTRHIGAGAVLAFVAAIGNFGIPALLGLPANYLTLPTLIYRRLSSFGPAVIANTAALSLVIGAIAFAGVLLAGAVLRGVRGQFEAGRPIGGVIRLGGARWPACALAWAFMAGALILPLLALLASALVPSYGMALTLETITLDKFVEVLTRQTTTVRAFRNSFLYAAGSALVLGALATAIAWSLERRVGRVRRAVEAVIDIPFALPGIVLAIASILLFLRPLPLVRVSLYATPWIIVYAYLARFLPLALKAPLASVALLPRAQEDAAADLGAGLFLTLRRVVIPALLPAAAAGALLVFLTAFNELTVSALLWAAGTETLGVVLFSLEEAGLASEAAAVAVSATVVVALAMGLLDRLGRRLPAGVLPWRM